MVIVGYPHNRFKNRKGEIYLAPTGRSLALFVLLILATAACGGGYARPVPLPGEAQPTVDPAEPAQSADDSVPPATTPTLSAPPPGFWIQPGVPQTIAERVSPPLAEAGYVPLDSPDGAALSIVLNPGLDADLTAQWVYAVAAPFATVPDGVSWEGFVRYWGGDLGALPAFGPAPDLALTAFLGCPTFFQ